MTISGRKRIQMEYEPKYPNTGRKLQEINKRLMPVLSPFNNKKFQSTDVPNLFSPLTCYETGDRW